MMEIFIIFVFFTKISLSMRRYFCTRQVNLVILLVSPRLPLAVFMCVRFNLQQSKFHCVTKFDIESTTDRIYVL